MRRFTRRRVSYVITHDQHDHGHLLGVNSLALDTTTVQQSADKPEGILYSAGRDGVIASWDLNLRFKERKTRSSLLNGSSSKVSISNLEKQAEGDEGDENVPLAQKLNEYKSDWELNIDELSTMDSPPKSTFRQSFQSHTDWVNDIILCHNNQTLISASSDRTLKLWHPHKSNSPVNVGYHTDYIKALAYAPGPGWVASGGFDRKIILWDITECRPSSESKLSIPVEHYFKPIVTIPEASPKSSVYALACNPSGTVLVSGSPEKIIRVWDPRSGKRIIKFTGHTDNIRAILVSDDGELILSGSSDTTIKLWSLRAQRCINTFTIHSDSVWTLFSDHPRLETFYSGSKDGLVARTDYSGYAEICDGECIAICKENAGIVKVVALDNTYVWTATSNSSINRWLDVPKHSRGKAFPSYTPAPSSPVSPSVQVIPSSAIIKLTHSDVSYAASSTDSEVATLHSSATDENQYCEADSDDPIPIRDRPEFVIPGQHGLIKHCILNNRRHILTLDTSGEVALWDIIMCIRIKTYGRCNMDDVYQEINTIESIPNWCSVDTRVGALTIHLEEARCFDAEIYADEVGVPEDPDIREEPKINLGKWVLRYLFSNFFQAVYAAHVIQRHQSANELHATQSPQSPLRPIPPHHISFPPATVHAGQFGDMTNMTANANLSMFNMNLPGANVAAPSASSSNAMNTAPHNSPQSPTTPLAAFTTGPYTAPATSTHGRSDYFTGSHHSSPTSPTGPSGMLTPPNTTMMDRMGSVATGQVIQPPPPAFVNQASSNNGSSSSVIGRIKHSFSSVRKLSRSPSSETKIDNFALGGSGNYSNLMNLAPQVPEGQSQGTTEEAKNNSLSGHTAETTPLLSDIPPVVQQNNEQPEVPIQPIPLGHFSLLENPEIHIPPHTTVIISEESHEASTNVDLYRGTMISLGTDFEEIHQKAPAWLIEFLIKNKVPPKDQVKVSFVLKPHEGSDLSELANGNPRLSANRILRVRKILTYVVEKLELEHLSVPVTTDPHQNRTYSAEGRDKQLEREREEEMKRFEILKPEMWLELICQDQILPPSMTLATIKSHIWKSGGDLVMYYRLRMKSV